jgi:hypothetical protein
MKKPLATVALVLMPVLVTGCAVSNVQTASTKRVDFSLGEDSHYEAYAENITRGEVQAQAPQVIVSPNGKKILAVVYPDPLAGVLTAQGLQVKVGKNQSNGFGKAMGTLNSAIAAWGILGTAKEATAQRASDNALKLGQAKEATAQVGLQTAPTVFDPALQEVSRAGGSVVIP